MIQLLQSYFEVEEDDSKLPPYFTLGAKPPQMAVVALDSSDQTVVQFDEHTGVAACRTGLTIVGADQEVKWRSIGSTIYVPSNPYASTEVQLRSKLTVDQSLRLITGRRPFYSSLRSQPALMPPRMQAGLRRVVEDYVRLRDFANSAYVVPGMLFLADGRLNAQNFPGPPAFDELGRLLRTRGVRCVGIAKAGMLLNVVRREARSIRRRVGDRPFAFPISEAHLRSAYRSDQTSKTPKTIRHGASTSALGGIGAFRFALSISGEHLVIAEMSLYDMSAFGHLIRSNESLEAFVNCSLPGKSNPAVYSWDVVRLASERDFELHIIPTLEEIVYSAYTDTELGIYPRALADVHQRVKLSFDDPELEAERRQIVYELARSGVPIETIPIMPDGSHKTDPDEFDALTP